MIYYVLIVLIVKGCVENFGMNVIMLYVEVCKCMLLFEIDN